MTTILKSAKKVEPSNPFSGTTLSSWSRQQKLAMVASFALLGLLLAVSACSKQSSKTALVGVSSSASNSAAASTPMASANSPVQAAVLDTAVATPGKTARKVQRKRPANVLYSDPNFGVSFVYPRKFVLASGDRIPPHFANTDTTPMNFVQSGGLTVATVAIPNTLYPGTDFASGFFTVNVNRRLSEQECSHFAFVDSSDADGEPIDAQKVKVGSTDMEMTSEFAGNTNHQIETAYYHHYENTACYEYVLSLGTAGYGAREGIDPVNREEVFARLEKILATVKTPPVAQEAVPQTPAVEQTVAAAGDTK